MGNSNIQGHDASKVPEECPLIVGTAPLPENLRGLFWLSQQALLSSLISFGGPNHDGDDLSEGMLGDDGSYRIEVMGDRVWSAATCFGEKFERQFMLTYNFEFDDPNNPTESTIHAESGCPGGVHPFCCFSFSMDLAPQDPEFPGSVMWTRKSKICGLTDKYKVVQVIDEFGKPIQPAWDHFLEYQGTSATCWSNKIYVRELMFGPKE